MTARCSIIRLTRHCTYIFYFSLYLSYKSFTNNYTIIIQSLYNLFTNSLQTLYQVSYTCLIQSFYQSSYTFLSTCLINPLLIIFYFSLYLSYKSFTNYLTISYTIIIQSLYKLFTNSLSSIFYNLLYNHFTNHLILFSLLVL
jgi:hypothetical protein